ncbi:MAG: phage terminase large subunit [Dehalococcoidia bacterium]|nr:phage terminase large subunit [Dehalococcoidia bacterium]
MNRLDKDTAAAVNDAARLELGRRSLLDFTRYTMPGYQVHWYHKLICSRLDDFEQKKITRLMLLMPPRHGKSELVSRRLPAYIFGRNPDARIIATSYNADFAQSMNRDVQRIMSCDEYRRLFPRTVLGGMDKQGAADGTYLRNMDTFEIVKRKGLYRCAGVGGGITGMGGDFIIIDDPIKNKEEANSCVNRDKIWDWYTSTLYTRQEKNAGILVTLTRWHEDDLVGRLLNAANLPDGDKWEVISLPAVRESCDCPYDPRMEGEALWPYKYDLTTLATIKTTVGSYDWAALYQQRPSPGDGGTFKREWWRRWTDDDLADLEDYLQSWDCAFSCTDNSDYVVGQVWARSSSNRAQRYLLDQVRGRKSFVETLDAIRALSAKWPRTQRKLIENTANGSAIIDVLKNEIPGIKPVDPKGGKIVRANAVTANAEAGNIFIPEDSAASWVSGFVEECVLFPRGAHDDQVDAMTQANTWYNENNATYRLNA